MQKCIPIFPNSLNRTPLSWSHTIISMALPFPYVSGISVMFSIQIRLMKY
jgi:hypothetical protein